MRLEDRKKVAAWLEGQITKLREGPRAALIGENIERLEKTVAGQKEIIRREVRAGRREQ